MMAQACGHSESAAAMFFCCSSDKIAMLLPRTIEVGGGFSVQKYKLLNPVVHTNVSASARRLLANQPMIAEPNSSVRTSRAPGMWIGMAARYSSREATNLDIASGLRSKAIAEKPRWYIRLFCRP